MDNLTNFDKLINNLSSIEKKELLEKVESSFEISQDPLIVQEEEAEKDFLNSKEEYEKLGILQKIFVMFLSLVRQKDIPTVLRERKVNALRKKYFHGSDLADFKNRNLNKSFLDELLKLKDPCRFFRKPLQLVFSYDNKQDFYAFIGGVILPDLQQDLLEKSDPWIIEKTNPDEEPSLIKSEIDTFFDMKMDSVSELDCSIMNEACQSLYGLHLLCSFDLNQIRAGFDSVLPDASPVCPIDSVHDPLLELAGILKSLNKSPTIRALEALFLYSAEKGESDEVLSKKLQVSNTFLSVIRDFNKLIPLERLVKVVSGDLSKNARTPAMVDDWFRIYRKFWSTRISRMYARFLNERKKNESEKEICTITGVRYIKPVEKYTRGHYFPGSPARYEKSLSFVLSFLNEMIPGRLSATLKIIAQEGDFYKKDNKTEFDKVLAYLDILRKKIQMIQSSINSSSFPYGGSDSSENEQNDLYQKIAVEKLENMDMEIESVLTDFISHLRILNKVMHGIVIGDGGAYDTLSNISSIGGKGNTELRENFKIISVMINKMVKYISEMKILEEKEL